MNERTIAIYKQEHSMRVLTLDYSCLIDSEIFNLKKGHNCINKRTACRCHDWLQVLFDKKNLSKRSGIILTKMYSELSLLIA